MFRAALERGVERFLYVSSSMVFERATEFPTTEAHIDVCPMPRSAYGFSKLTGEVFTIAAARRARAAVHDLPPFQRLRPRGDARGEPGIAHLVPDVIRKVYRASGRCRSSARGARPGRSPTSTTSRTGSSLRCATLLALNQDFNISAGQELTVAEIARVIWQVCGRSPEEFELEHLPSYRVDVQRRWPSVEKARTLLGWEARVDLRDGVAQTADWLRGVLRPTA